MCLMACRVNLWDVTYRFVDRPIIHDAGSTAHYYRLLCECATDHAAIGQRPGPLST